MSRASSKRRLFKYSRPPPTLSIYRFNNIPPGNSVAQTKSSVCETSLRRTALSLFKQSSHFRERQIVANRLPYAAVNDYRGSDGTEVRKMTKVFLIASKFLLRIEWDRRFFAEKLGGGESDFANFLGISLCSLVGDIRISKIRLTLWYEGV